MGRDLAFIVAGQVMVALQSLIAMPIIIRLAGPAIYGANALLASTVFLLFNLVRYGISYQYQRNLVSASTAAERRRLFEPQFAFQVVSTGIVCVIVLLIHPVIENRLFDGSVHFSSWSLIALLAATLLYNQVITYFQCTQHFLPASLAYGIRPYLYVTLLVVVAFVWKTLSLDALLAMATITLLCVSLPLMSLMLREIGLPRFRMPLHALIASARLGWPLMIEMVVDFILSTSDRYLIAVFLSIAYVGEYQPAYTLATLPLFLQTISDPLLTPAVSRLIDQGARAEAENMIAVFVRLFLMFVIPFAVGALMIGPSILGLLATPAIGMAGRWVVPLVAVATGFFGIMRFASLVAFVLGRTRLMVAPIFVGASINVGLNLLLLPLLKDITVAGFTTLLGYVASAVYACMLLHGEWRVVIDFKSILRFCAGAAVMGGSLWLLGYSPGVVTGLGIPHLIAAVAIGVIVYFSVLWALGGFGRRELDQLGSLLRRRMPRASEMIQ